MDALAQQAGAGDELKRYLRERGLTSAGAFAMIAQSQDQFDAFIVAPLLARWQSDPAADVISIPEKEHPIARAILRFMWTLAREARARAASAVTSHVAPNPAQPSGGAALASSSTDPAKGLASVESCP